MAKVGALYVPGGYMFPAECYGASGDNFTACAYNVDPVKPIGRWKEAWEAARDRAGYILAGVPLPESSSPKRKRAVNSQGEHPAKRQEKPKPIKCRFHDLRHTGCTRMLEAGVPFSVVATVMGWSSATTIRMAKRYGHIGQAAQREAVAFLSGADFGTGRAQNWAQPEERAESGRAN